MEWCPSCRYFVPFSTVLRTVVDASREKQRLAGDGGECGGGAGESLGERVELGLGAGGVGGVDGFVDSWQHDGFVAGELAWSEYAVAIPGAAGKARGDEECGFD